ncbi:hypothetical protein PFISCL1PPCAC_25392, partial [Pristionchus fissidentatus]
NPSRESLSAEPVDDFTMHTHIPWAEVADLETRLLEILYRAGKPNVRSLRIKFTRRRRGLDVLFSFALCEDCTALSGTDEKEVQCDLLPPDGIAPFTYSIRFGPTEKMNRMDNSIQVGES